MYGKHVCVSVDTARLGENEDKFYCVAVGLLSQLFGFLNHLPLLFELVCLFVSLFIVVRSILFPFQICW